MNWHERYLQQSTWTRDLRRYVFQKCDWQSSRRILEVGCGTGAVLQNPAATEDAARAQPELHGLDIAVDALAECRLNVPSSCLTRGDAVALPYPAGGFNITYCHFLLLWLRKPIRALQEMRRVTMESGYVLAFAEPDYGARADEPAELAWLGQRQNEALERQGAALRRGAELADLFQQAGLKIIETGIIRPATHHTASPNEWESEWRVLEADLTGLVGVDELRRRRALDQAAWQRGEHRLSIPTYFAWGQV